MIGGELHVRRPAPQSLPAPSRRAKQLVQSFPSVVSAKFAANFGEQSALLARRADAGISGIFRGGATPPEASRAGEIGSELRGHHTSLAPRAKTTTPTFTRAARLVIATRHGLHR